MVVAYRCGHAGRENDPGYRTAKASGFIRVAELRGQPVVREDKPCPGCRAQPVS